MTDEVEPRYKKVIRLEALARSSAQIGEQSELARGLLWTISEIKLLDERHQFHREQNERMAATIRNIAPDLFGKGSSA